MDRRVEQDKSRVVNLEVSIHYLSHSIHYILPLPAHIYLTTDPRENNRCFRVGFVVEMTCNGKKRTTITKDPEMINTLSRLYQEKGRRRGERYKLWGLKVGEF